MTIKRTFTRAELEDLGLPYDGGDCVRSDEITDQKRWASVHHLVFEHDSALWQVTYYEPATEMQECDPWGYGAEPETVGAVQVEPYTVEVTRYRPVSDEPARISETEETTP